MDDKNILLLLGEWWQRRSINKKKQAAHQSGRHWLPTPGNVIFTLLMIGLLLWVQTVGAVPLGLSNAATNTTAGTIAYQGRLADADGTPVTATVNMIFRLYNQATGGTPLWEEQWTGSNAVQVSDGLFNVMLGSLTPIPQSVITGNGSLFLGITVGTDDEMSPRVQLGNVPWAVQALTVPDGSINASKLRLVYGSFGPNVVSIPFDANTTWQAIGRGTIELDARQTLLFAFGIDYDVSGVPAHAGIFIDDDHCGIPIIDLGSGRHTIQGTCLATIDPGPHTIELRVKKLYDQGAARVWHYTRVNYFSVSGG